jgi:hypothetical protein
MEEREGALLRDGVGREAHFCRVANKRRVFSPFSSSQYLSTPGFSFPEAVLVVSAR